MSFEAARRAEADQVAHHEPEIEGARMNQHALENVRVAAQMGAAHAAGVIEMGEGPFGSARRAGASGGGPVGREFAGDCHTPGPASPVPSTSPSDFHHGLPGMNAAHEPSMSHGASASELVAVSEALNIARVDRHVRLSLDGRVRQIVGSGM